MHEHFRISVRFLDGEFHGRGDGGEPEWPPSPLRLFQALTNAAARLDSDGNGATNAAALRWLEELTQPPEIIADNATPTNGYQLYVPDNVGDLVAKKWAAGKYFDSKNHVNDLSRYRTDKRVRPLHIEGDAAVHYVWTFEDEDFAAHRETLISIARAVSRLGWGVDLVVVDADTKTVNHTTTRHTAERWLPVESHGGKLLRTPVSGTLQDLVARHSAFLGRLQLETDGTHVFRPVPPLTKFRVITYRRETEQNLPPHAIFALRLPDDSGFASFDTKWRRLHLTGMLRHSASQADFAASLGWTNEKVNSFVLGHGPEAGKPSRPTKNTTRLVFTPLPSIEWRGEKQGRSIGTIRRVMLSVSGNAGKHDIAEFGRIVRSLEGRELIDEMNQQACAFLRRQPDSESAITNYFGESARWTTVTPMVLPGYDDPRKLRRRLGASKPPLSAAEKGEIVRKLDSRIDRLIRKAFRESGMPDPLVSNAGIEWRGSGFLPGAALSSHYSVPNQCRHFRRLHVRVTWRERSSDGTFNPIAIKGPLCAGSGRFSGLGLFIPCE